MASRDDVGLRGEGERERRAGRFFRASTSGCRVAAVIFERHLQVRKFILFVRQPDHPDHHEVHDTKKAADTALVQRVRSQWSPENRGQAMMKPSNTGPG